MVINVMHRLQIILLLLTTLVIAGCTFVRGEPEPTTTGYNRQRRRPASHCRLKPRRRLAALQAG